MISPFLAAAREKSPSELFPDPAGTHRKPEGEKNDRFSRLLHRCEQPSQVPLTEDGPKDIPFPAPHAAFTAMLRRMDATGEEGAPVENGGEEAVFSDEETGILFSGAIPGQGDLPPEEALSLPGELPPESGPDGESAATAAGMMVRDDVSLEEGRGMRVLRTEEQAGSASGTASPFGLPPEDNVPCTIDAGSLREEAPGNQEMNEQRERTASEKQFSDVLLDEDRLTNTLSRKNEPEPGQSAEPLSADLSSDEHTKGFGISGQGNRDASSPAPAAAMEADPVPEGSKKTGGSEGQENRLLSSASRKDGIPAGHSGNGGGEKGEGRQSMSGKNDGTGAALFSHRPAQGMESVRTEKSLLPGGFARELALAGRGGDALEDGMHNVVRFMRTEGHHRASMIVDPPALGRVEIELASTNGGVEASIRVGNEQLRQLVQDQITVLRTHLQQQGVQVAELTVDIRDSGGEGHGEARDGSKNRDVRASGRVGAAEEDIPSYTVDLEKGLLHWVA